jgi:hypothetical protein
MQIICSTMSAAAEVVAILLDAGLRPFYDFQISPVLSTVPPIIFTVLRPLSAPQLDQIRILSDITIETAAAA